ncbi:MAG: twin-arginine translocase TatA/TatE family subunit [Planctomycetia bacterium]|nr:twin-arginine translocase TatA/TatE family subunit [Planctomycetia bacterium]
MEPLFVLGLAPVFGWAPGPLELSIVAFVALLLLGTRLPSVMRSLGSSFRSFREGLSDVKGEIEEAGR